MTSEIRMRPIAPVFTAHKRFGMTESVHNVDRGCLYFMAVNKKRMRAIPKAKPKP
jgi:hypothetical protein